MTERTECLRCRTLDERDEPFDVYPIPTVMRRKDSDELVMLAATDVNEPDHLCEDCCAEYAAVMAEFMGKDFVMIIPVDEDGCDLPEDEGGDDASEEEGT
jgi:hypothetical protein